MNHKMSMTDSVGIGLKTSRIDSGCSMEKNFTKDLYESLNGMISKYKLG